MPDAHEIWAAAQLAPGEGIEDGVARIEALLALPAPAGEPEMPETVGYLLTGSRTFVDDVVRTESAAYRRRTERNDRTVAEPLVRESAATAYGHAMAEHARTPPPGYVLAPVRPTRAMWEAGANHCRHEDHDDTYTAIGCAIAVWSDMIAAALPPPLAKKKAAL